MKSRHSSRPQRYYRLRLFVSHEIVPVLLCFAGSWVHGATLGGLQVRSSLGQPLEAQIEVMTEKRTLSAACFRTVGGDGEDVAQIRDVVFGWTQTKAGGILTLRSVNPVNEPVSTLTVQLACPGMSSTQRRYMLLLDPPANLPLASSTAPLSTAAAKTSRADEDRPSLGGIWRVREGDTLRSIARHFFPDSQPIRIRMLARMKQLNTWVDSRTYLPLPAGQTIRLPTAQEIGVSETSGSARAASTSARTVSPTRASSSSIAPPKTARLPSHESGPAPKSGNGRLTLQAGSAPTIGTAGDSAAALDAREARLLDQAAEMTASLGEVRQRIHQLEQQQAFLREQLAQRDALVNRVMQQVAAERAARIPLWLQWAPLVLMASMVLAMIVWMRQMVARTTSALDVGGLNRATPPAAARIPFSDPAPAAPDAAFAREMAASQQPDRALQPDDIALVQPDSVLEEVQLLLDSGFPEQAIRVLDAEVTHAPQQVNYWMRLFELYAEYDRRKDFEALAQRFRQHFLSESLWARVQTIGARLSQSDAPTGEAQLVFEPEELHRAQPDNSAVPAPADAASPTLIELPVAADTPPSAVVRQASVPLHPALAPARMLLEHGEKLAATELLESLLLSDDWSLKQGAARMLAEIEHWSESR
jgi:Tfp pilus assembly protein FimV